MSSRNIRLALSTAVMISTGILAGCPAVPNPRQITPENLNAPTMTTDSGAMGVYETLRTTQPLVGAALERGRRDRDAVLAFVKLKVVPAAMAPSSQPGTPPAATTHGATAIAEPPPLALKYYLQGRERFLQGANSEAMDFLEKALKLDPEAFTVLRLMGRVCFAASQLPRGSMFLERAHTLRPNDVEVNYLLGRYWLERKDFERAVYYLMKADDSPDQQTSSTQTPLSAFFLARSLQEAGFHLAAAKEFERFLALASLPVSGYRYDRELGFLIDELWSAHLAAAENAVLVGDYAMALPHYLKAAAAQPRDAYIVSRLLNAMVHTGQFEAARVAAMKLLATQGGEDAIKLAAWTYGVSGREAELIEDVRAALKMGASETSAAVLTLAAMQDYLGKKADAFKTLQGHLEIHPTDLRVLATLAGRVDSQETFREARQLSAEALAADRMLHDQILKLYLPVTEGPQAAIFFKKPHEKGFGKRTFALCYLDAVAQRAQNAAPEDIDGDFQAALALAPDFGPAREAYVVWLLEQEKFSKVSALVQEGVTREPNNPKAWQLLVESEASQQRYLSALKLAQDAKAKFPNHAGIRMQVAGIYRLRGQDAQADAELQTIVNDMPKFEPGYRSLVNSLFERIRRGPGNPETAIGTIVALLAKLNQEVPTSRFGQINSALFLARSGRLEESETLLRKMVADTPDDQDVVIPLAQVRQALGRTGDAVATLQTALQSHPQPDLVRAMASAFWEEGKPGEALALAKKMMQDSPANEAYLFVYEEELVRQEKSGEAIALMTAARRAFPRSQRVAMELSRLQERGDDFEGAVLTMQAFMKENGETAERLYSLSHYFSAAGDENAAAAALQRVLAIMPDHTGANNDLGYAWANGGVHLDEAEKMIRRAVENEPNNAAYQDSLGWLAYKQGRFDEAVKSLDSAIHLPHGEEPDVLQHLGDALCRANRMPEAIERWTQAASMLNTLPGMTKEQQKLSAYLKKTIADAKAGKVPEISPVVEAAPSMEKAGTKAAGPTAPSGSQPQ